MMDLFIDLKTNRFITNPGFAQGVETVSFKRGDSSTIRLYFCRDGETLTLSPGSLVHFGIKPNGAYDGDFLVFANTYTLISGAYVISPSFNTIALNALLNHDGNPANDIASHNAMLEVTWSENGSTWQSTNTITAAIFNDVIKGEEGAPTSEPSPDDFVAARSVLFDRSQSLSSSQQTVARDNINAAPANFNRIHPPTDWGDDFVYIYYSGASFITASLADVGEGEASTRMYESGAWSLERTSGAWMLKNGAMTWIANNINGNSTPRGGIFLPVSGGATGTYIVPAVEDADSNKFWSYGYGGRLWYMWDYGYREIPFLDATNFFTGNNTFNSLNVVNDATVNGQIEAPNQSAENGNRVITRDNFYDLMNQGRIIRGNFTGWHANATVGSGSSNFTTYEPWALILSGTTANSSIMVRNATSYRSWLYGKPGVSHGDCRWEVGMRVSVRFIVNYGTSDSQQLTRWQWGMDRLHNAPDELSNAGIGFKIENRALKAFVHNNTALTVVDLGHSCADTQVNCISFIHVGSGKWDFYVNGILKGTTANNQGPNGNAGGAARHQISAYITNGTTAAQRAFYFEPVEVIYV